MSLLCYWAVAFLGDTLTRVDTGVFVLGERSIRRVVKLGVTVIATIRQLWSEDRGQDVAEYAVMLAVILVIVIGTVRLIGGNANNVFSQVSSQMSQ
jgi:Flp pilus assembly pilin Flp